MKHWRGIMGAVAEKCGVNVAEALMEELPGTRFYVPKKFTENGPLAPLGKELAEAFIAEYAGDIVYIPSKLEARPTAQQRFGEIEALVDAGLTTSQIAAKLGISQARVFQIRREVGAPKISKKPDPRQLAFFEDPDSNN